MRKLPGYTVVNWCWILVKLKTVYSSYIHYICKHNNIFIKNKISFKLYFKVDPDGLGLVLMPLFLEEFFPEFQVFVCEILPFKGTVKEKLKGV